MLFIHLLFLFFKKKRNIKKVFGKPISTDGIEMSQVKIKGSHGLKLPCGKLIFNLWDFGGQKVYHLTHGFFLSKGALYLIAWNICKLESEIESIIKWHNIIRTVDPNPYVLLIGTHLDDAIKMSLDIEGLYNELSFQTGIPIQNILGVSSQDGENFDQLVELLVRYSSSLPHVTKVFPKMYLDLKEKLEIMGREKKVPIIEFEELKEIARSCQIVGERQVEKASAFLHTLGFCLHFSNNSVTEYILPNEVTFKKNFLFLKKKVNKKN